MSPRSSASSARQQYGAVMLGVLAFCAMPCGASAQAVASPAPAARANAFDLPPAPLASTLREISRIGGVRIDMDAESVSGTSALDEDNERRIYQALIGALPDSALISVAHRSALLQYHDHVLEMTSASSAS